MPAKLKLTMLVYIFDGGTLDIDPTDTLELHKNGTRVASVMCGTVPVKSVETPGGDTEHTAFITVGSNHAAH